MNSPSSRTAAKQQLIRQHAPLVEKIARNMSRSLAACVTYDDLVQDGMVGLIEAILRTSKTTAGVQFERYLTQCAKGAMLDGLRAADPGSRSVRQGMRQVELAVQQLGHRLGRAPRESEVSRELGLTLSKYRRLLQDAHGYSLISIEDLDASGDLQDYLLQCASTQSDPLIVMERAALRLALANAIRTLSRQDQLLLHLYYHEGLRMHEIGTVLSLSEARISQLHTQAIVQLRASFVVDEDPPPVLKPRRKARDDAAVVPAAAAYTPT